MVPVNLKIRPRQKNPNAAIMIVFKFFTVLGSTFRITPQLIIGCNNKNNKKTITVIVASKKKVVLTYILPMDLLLLLKDSESLLRRPFASPISR